MMRITESMILAPAWTMAMQLLLQLLSRYIAQQIQIAASTPATLMSIKWQYLPA
jgi:hypothetical protein